MNLFTAYTRKTLMLIAVLGMAQLGAMDPLLCPPISQKAACTECIPPGKQVNSKDEFDPACDNFFVLQTCNHYFHETCILAWLNVASTCPTCRRAIVT